MSFSNIVFVSTFFILLICILLVMVWTFYRRTSRIDEELRAITVILSEIPREDSLKEYMFAQDQRLRGIGEQLHNYPDIDVLQHFIQDQTNQIVAVTSSLGKVGNSEISKADLEDSLQKINDSLNKVLWSLRFDEDMYLKCTEEKVDSQEYISNDKSNCDCINSGNDSSNLNQSDDLQSMIINGEDDYTAILKYMEKTGKSGTDALRALEIARGMRSRK
jgi:hypothetical protein